MRVKIFLLILFFSSIAGFLVISLLSKDAASTHLQIQENLDELLKQQLADLNDFESQLSIYSNPFAIPAATAFSKRVFLNGGLLYWNNTEKFPEYGRLKQSESLYVIEGEFGVLIIRRKEVVTNSDLIEIFSVLPVLTVPPITNQYLKEELNPKIFEDFNAEIAADTGTFTLSFDNQDLFRINLTGEKDLRSQMLLFIMLLLAWSSLLLLFVGWIRFKGWHPAGKLVVLCTGVVISRVLLHFWTRHYVVNWDLFNPVYFTGDWLYFSLGDLLINSICGLILLSFAYYIFFRKGSGFSVFSALNNRFLAFVVSLAVISLAWLTYYNVWTILENSQIEFDISRSIQFDFLRIAAFFFVVLQGLTFLLAFNIGNRLLVILRLRNSWKYIIILSVYLLLSALLGGEALIYLGVFVFIWLLIDFFQLGERPGEIRYKTFLYLMFIFIAFSVISAFAVYKHYEKDTLVAKQKFGNRLLIKNDILGELYLNEIIGEIEQDRYIRSRLLSQVLSRQNIREKIKRQFLSSYFKKYDINIFLFDNEGNSLSSLSAGKTYNEWQTQYQQRAYATDYPKIYFIQDDADHVRNKYICFIDVEAFGRKVGYIVLDLTLKKYISSSVFPELLLENRFYISGNEEFDYAVFKSGSMLFKQGRFSFENKLVNADLKNEGLYKRGMEEDGTHYYGVRTSDGRTIIIVSSIYPSAAFVANFSFIFLLLIFSSGLLFVLLQLGRGISRFNLSTKIQLYLGFSFIFPMLIVSIALLNTLNRSYREEIDRNFQKRSYNLAENLIDRTEAFSRNQINIDVFGNEISEAAALAQSDINIYDVNGRLITSSQPEIFRVGILSGLIDPEAFYSIKYKKEQNLINEKRIGELDFKTSYTALRSYQDGRLLAILSMPYFDSKNHLRRQQIEVFNNLISVFTIIFLVALVAGNTIVGQLIRPLKKIGEKLRSTSLQEENKPIPYDAQDEIGTLIKEYNQMLIKLEESKAALAVSQKESAWKEIARQVAHEIKNPLTPMRLKIQQMMKGFDRGEKNHKTCELLISQIDSLSSIADSFSEFAKMPVPQYEVVNCVELIDAVLDLYATKGVVIHRHYENEQFLVNADPKILSRIFTNIVLNAIQAKATGRPEVMVNVADNNRKVLIEIADNGSGIPNELKENIFTPYFSTKTKGSGIGLAVAKKGIENAGGHIWFESEEGRGTTFFITLPVYTD